MDITNQIFEPRHRMMDVEYEDLLYGVDLTEGMLVLHVRDDEPEWSRNYVD